MFWSFLGYIVTKACTSQRNSTWFTRLFLLERGWGLRTRLGADSCSSVIRLSTGDSSQGSGLGLSHNTAGFFIFLHLSCTIWQFTGGKPSVCLARLYHTLPPISSQLNLGPQTRLIPRPHLVRISLPVLILKAICAGVGLCLGPRLGPD